MADELTLDFAEALIKAEKIGQGPHTDMLAISFFRHRLCRPISLP